MSQVEKNVLAERVNWINLYWKYCYCYVCIEADQTLLLQAPVQLFTLEGRYATALYSAATKQKALGDVEKDLKEFNVSYLILM